MSGGPTSLPGRAALSGLLAIGAFILVSGVAFVLQGEGWAWAGTATGAAMVLTALLGLRRSRWIGPLQAGLAALGGGCLAAGVVSDDAGYFQCGLLVLSALGLSLPIVHLLGRIAEALEAGPGSAGSRERQGP